MANLRQLKTLVRIKYCGYDKTIKMSTIRCKQATFKGGFFSSILISIFVSQKIISNALVPKHKFASRPPAVYIK